MSDKKCGKCGAIKPLTEFHVSRRRADGRAGHCKVCIKERDSKRYECPVVTEKMKKQALQYYVDNKEHCDSRNSEWKSSNRGAVNALSAKRRAKKLQATPAWADKDAIKALYEEAQRLQEILGIQFHIDHVIPLQGELVCGLHVETNLQVIPATLNIRKSNKFKVE